MASINGERQEAILQLRFAGLTYVQIAGRLGISRQRVHQLIAPPTQIRDAVVQRAGGQCQDCGLQVNGSGHVHHVSCHGENYNDLENLRLLCGSCHQKAHRPSNGKNRWIPLHGCIGRPKGAKTRKPNAYAGRSDRVRQKHGKRCYQRWGRRGGNPVLLASGMEGEVEIVQIGARGTGMTMYSAQHLIREVMANPGQTVYVNFELPEPLKEIIERYATVEKVKLPEELKGLSLYSEVV